MNIKEIFKTVSIYSNKKIHSYALLLLVFYLCIFTTNESIILIVCGLYAGVLGLREYSKAIYNNKEKE